MIVNVGLKRGTSNPKIRQGLSVLRKFGADAHAYIPGIGSINGLTAGNYLDSAGSTPVTMDGLVGRMNDAAQTLGPELVTNGSFSNGATGWTLSGGFSISGGTAQSSGGVSELLVSTQILTAGKSYVVEFDITSISAANIKLNNIGFTCC